MSVRYLIDKFAEQDQLSAALEEVKETRQLYEQTLEAKNTLESEMNERGGASSIRLTLCKLYLHIDVYSKLDGMVTYLKEKARSLEDLLRISRHTIATLQDKLQDLQKSYQQNVSMMEAKLQDAADAKMTPDALVEIVNQSSASTAEKKETLLRTYERIQAQERLEGADKGSGNSILSVPVSVTSVCLILSRDSFTYYEHIR